jgi:hypothetical protein
MTKETIAQVLHFWYTHGMSTTKRRINITADADVEAALKLVAERDGVPMATKAAELLRNALELEEDLALGAIAEERERAHVKFISHEEFWKQNNI